MRAKEWLDAGDLSRAIDTLTAELRDQPNDVHRRSFLFELFCFAGEWDRAGRQLNVIGHQDETPAGVAGVTTYQRMLESEKQRADLFARGEPLPRFLLEPPPAIALHLEALKSLGAGKTAEARAALDQAGELRQPIPGRWNQGEFADLRDTDDLLAPVLEVFGPGGYFWLPWEHIQFLEVPPPKALRDLLWAPARLAGFDGQLGEVFLPNLYPGSCRQPDDRVKLGRLTDWIDVGEGIMRGIGQRTLLVGDEARTLFELGEVQFSGADPPGSPA